VPRHGEAGKQEGGRSRLDLVFPPLQRSNAGYSSTPAIEQPLTSPTLASQQRTVTRFGGQPMPGRRHATSTQRGCSWVPRGLTEQNAWNQIRIQATALFPSPNGGVAVPVPNHSLQRPIFPQPLAFDEQVSVQLTPLALTPAALSSPIVFRRSNPMTARKWGPRPHTHSGRSTPPAGAAAVRQPSINGCKLHGQAQAEVQDGLGPSPHTASRTRIGGFVQALMSTAHPSSWRPCWPGLNQYKPAITPPLRCSQHRSLAQEPFRQDQGTASLRPQRLRPLKNRRG